MRWLLALPLVLAACVPAPSRNDTASFAHPGVPAAAFQTAPTASVSRAAARSFGLGLRRDDRNVTLAGREMGLRVVVSMGHRFAVFHHYGVPFTLRAHPDLSAEAQLAAQSFTGCPTSGKTYRQTNSNGAFPKYAVHLLC